MKKILFLAPATNYHTKKWCDFFQGQKYEVHVISLTNGEIPNVNVHCIMSSEKTDRSDIQKIGYLWSVSRINQIYDDIRPDIVSVHYATSYGILAALSKIKKYSLSVWGTDVYAFPKKSMFHRALVKYSLKKASILLSTSKAMSEECRALTNKKFYITPFGVNMDIFNPSRRDKKSEDFVISNMKSLSPEYGTDVLLRSIREVINQYPKLHLRVYIAGDGPSALEFKKLSSDLGLDKYVFWLGLVPQETVVHYLVNSDIAVIPSYRESFGVSAVEAQACGIPVIISNIDGLKEATSPGVTSVVFETGNYKALSSAIIDLYVNKSKREEMGQRARDFVVRNYEYKECFERIEKILNNF